MSDAHKVNEDTRMEDMEVLPSEIKDLLITWLFKFGHKVIPQNTAWDYLVDNANLNYDINATLNACCDAKYIWRIETAKGYEHLAPTRYQLLHDGVEFLNKGEKNEQ
jgi:hypothetical protein